VPLALILTLSPVFLAPGVYKLRHPLIAATTAVNFRIVGKPTRRIGYVLGGAETAVATLLVFPTSWVAVTGCLAASVLSLGYCIILARSLVRRERFPCNCLPLLGGEVSVAALLRAFAMLVMAALAGIGALESNMASGSRLTALATAVCLLGLSLAIYAAMRSYRLYGRSLHETDWTWVIAARAGHVVTK
jgi:hypothetical protein